MKKLKTVALIAGLITSTLMVTTGYAQPNFINPSNSDGAFATINAIPTWMNNANIKVGTNSIGAVTWMESGTVYAKAVVNTTLGGLTTVAVPNANYSSVKNPDVVLGTDNAGTILCGVVYTAIGINPTRDDIWMNLYTVNTGNGNLALQCRRQISTTGSAVGNAHIDLINRSPIQIL